MSVETWTAVSSGVVGVASAAAAAWSGRAARRTRRDHRRDDFSVVTDAMRKEMERQGARIVALEQVSDRQDQRLEGAGVAITYLIDRVRGLLILVRSAGLEPPSAAPIPDQAREFINQDV